MKIAVKMFKPMGWELTFIIRAFGLSAELSIVVGFGFSDKGLKYKNLQIRTKKKCDAFLQMFSEIIFILEILSIYYTMPTQFMRFFMWKIHLTHLNLKCVGNLPRTNLKS